MGQIKRNNWSSCVSGCIILLPCCDILAGFCDISPHYVLLFLPHSHAISQPLMLENSKTQKYFLLCWFFFSMFIKSIFYNELLSTQSGHYFVGFLKIILHIRNINQTNLKNYCLINRKNKFETNHLCATSFQITVVNHLKDCYNIVSTWYVFNSWRHALSFPLMHVLRMVGRFLDCMLLLYQVLECFNKMFKMKELDKWRTANNGDHWPDCLWGIGGNDFCS